MTGPERLEYIRKQYEKTGRTFEQLDRQSQQYMATTIGMTQEEAALAFAQNNRGVGLDQIKKKSAEAEKKQLTQAEALQKLAGSIERLVKGGGGGVTTLFEAFTKGFETAIFRSRDFRQIMRNIRQILRTTRLAGMQVGRAFVEMFPGVKNILGGLADLFNPTRWKATMRKVVEVFKDFFRDLQTNPEAGLSMLNELFTTPDFVYFVNDLIDNFEGVEIIMDEEEDSSDAAFSSNDEGGDDDDDDDDEEFSDDDDMNNSNLEQRIRIILHVSNDVGDVRSSCIELPESLTKGWVRIGTTKENANRRSSVGTNVLRQSPSASQLHDVTKKDGGRRVGCNRNQSSGASKDLPTDQIDRNQTIRA
jgi:hypothetical protein